MLEHEYVHNHSNFQSLLLCPKTVDMKQKNIWNGIWILSFKPELKGSEEKEENSRKKNACHCNLCVF